jgi:hypothetical protein
VVVGLGLIVAQRRWLLISERLSTTHRRGRTTKPGSVCVTIWTVRCTTWPGPDQQPSRLSGIGPDQGDGGEAFAQPGQQSVGCVAVLQPGHRDDHGQQQAAGVHSDVTFASVTLS